MQIRRTHGIQAALAIVLASALGAASAKAAEPWPTGPVKIVIPFAAGATADALPRIVGEQLAVLWKQPVIFENRTGAGGSVGAEFVIKSAPDGYTLLASATPPFAMNQYLYKRSGYDPTQLKPITVLAHAPTALAVNPKVGAGTLAELIEKAKAKPGDLVAASQGNGTTSHLTLAMLEARAGVKIRHVPYRGSAPGINDLLGGHVDMMFDNVSSLIQHHRAGALKVLAICAPQRVETLPDVPTAEEAGLKGFFSIAWFAMAAPPGTPDDIVAKISADTAAVLKLDSVRQRFLAQSALPIGNTPQEMAAFVDGERKLWKGVIEAANVRIEE